MKQTAVEWLFQVWVEQEHIAPEQWEMVKAMEKEQIMDAHYAPKYGCFSKDYYNETFKSE